MDKYTIALDKVGLDDIGLVGGKAASLGEMIGELTEAGVPVPPGFAVTAVAYDQMLDQTIDQSGLRSRLAEILTGIDARDPADIARRGHLARSLIRQAGLPDDVAEAVRQAYRAFARSVGEEPSVAVRSSATAEDLPEASFAGQQATLLNVRGEAAVVGAVLECFASMFTDRAISYREEQGFPHMAVRGAVAVQLMIRADLGSAGVIFTLDPDSGHDGFVVVTGAWGLGESVVAGRVDPDEVCIFKPTLATAKDPIVRRQIGRKQTRMVYGRRGGATTRTIPVAAADRMRRCFSDEDARTLAQWAVAIERHYTKHHGIATPMDIEWGKDGETGALYILQARPETVQSHAEVGKLVRHVVQGDPKVLVEGVAIGRSLGQGPVRVIRSISELSTVQEGEVLVSEMTDPDWVPALRRASAVVTDRGGRTCHAAIVCRELGVPCVVGTGTATQRLTTGQAVTVSCARGSKGEVLEGLVPFERTTVDVGKLPRTRTDLMLILADPDQAMELSRLPVAGVGLVRQEFIAANHIGIHPMAALHPERTPAEVQRRIEELCQGHASPAAFWSERLVEALATIAAAFFPRRVIVRLSDFKSNEYRGLIGGETFEPFEENPMIGLRGASRYLHPDFAEAFDLECRALARLRGPMGLHNIDLMVPFCRTPQEGRDVVSKLESHGLVRGANGLRLLVMCEVPSNVALVDRFAEIFDGFSIGSNDLTQLVLGVDRNSAALAPLFRENDEAVTRTISAAIKGAHAGGCFIGLCGQAPSDDPEFARFLVNEGIDSISLTADGLLAALQVVAAAELGSPNTPSRTDRNDPRKPRDAGV